MESGKIDFAPKISPSGSPRLDFKSKAFILQKIISYLFKIFLLQDNIIPIITHTELLRALVGLRQISQKSKNFILTEEKFRTRIAQIVTDFYAY